MVDDIARSIGLSATILAQDVADQVAQLPEGMVYKGQVEHFTDLPTTGNREGWIYTVVDRDYAKYIWGRKQSTGQMAWNQFESSIPADVAYLAEDNTFTGDNTFEDITCADIEASGLIVSNNGGLSGVEISPTTVRVPKASSASQNYQVSYNSDAINIYRLQGGAGFPVLYKRITYEELLTNPVNGTYGKVLTANGDGTVFWGNGGGGSGGSSNWGQIEGDITRQTDLMEKFGAVEEVEDYLQEQITRNAGNIENNEQDIEGLQDDVEGLQQKIGYALPPLPPDIGEGQVSYTLKCIIRHGGTPELLWVSDVDLRSRNVVGVGAAGFMII